MKFLKAVRLDASDGHLYSDTGAATSGEWLVSGGYAVCDPAGASRRTAKCRCLSSFVGVESHGRCAIAEVAEIGETEYRGIVERLVRDFRRRSPKWVSERYSSRARAADALLPRGIGKGGAGICQCAYGQCNNARCPQLKEG